MMTDITVLPEAQRIHTSAGWKSLNTSTTPILSKCERKNKRDFWKSRWRGGSLSCGSQSQQLWAELHTCAMAAPRLSPLPSPFRDAARRRHVKDRRQSRCIIQFEELKISSSISRTQPRRSALSCRGGISLALEHIQRQGGTWDSRK